MGQIHYIHPHRGRMGLGRYSCTQSEPVSDFTGTSRTNQVRTCGVKLIGLTVLKVLKSPYYFLVSRKKKGVPSNRYFY